MESNEPAIAASELSKTYRSGLFGGQRFEALKGVTFTVDQGEVFGLLGPNGAGKTTFIKILLGIVKKSGGSATMLGHRAGSRSARQSVGYLPEHLRMAPHLTANTALEYFGNLSGVSVTVVRQRRADLLRRVGLEGRERESIRRFSKGMLQRLGLAQALLHDPKLLILDEPTDGLDPGARAQMRAIIRDLADRGVTIFLNSHLLQEVELICRRVAILNQGSLVYSGSVEDIGQQLSGQTAGRLAMTLAGDRDALQRAFEGSQFDVVRTDDEKVEVTVSAKSQSDIDELIDRLRAERISIVAMQPPRLTLEDAFLKLVK